MTHPCSTYPTSSLLRTPPSNAVIFDSLSGSKWQPSSIERGILHRGAGRGGGGGGSAAAGRLWRRNGGQRRVRGGRPRALVVGSRARGPRCMAPARQRRRASIGGLYLSLFEITLPRLLSQFSFEAALNLEHCSCKALHSIWHHVLSFF